MSTALFPQQVEAELELPSLPPLQVQDCNASRGNEPPKPADHNRSSGDPPGVNPNEQADRRRRIENLGNLQPPQSSSNHRSMSDHPADDATLGPTRDDARNPEPHQPSTRRRPSNSSGQMEPPRPVKRHRPGGNQKWSQREDEVLRDCMKQGGSLPEAVEKLKSIGSDRGYNACKARWNRIAERIPRTYEQPGSPDDDSTYSLHGARPDHRRRRANFTRACSWRAQEDVVIMREYAGDSTDWESVAVEVNGLCLVPSLATPRTAGSCETRYRIIRDSDDESEDNDDDEQHGDDRDLSTRLEMSGTVTNTGDKGVALRGPTFTTGGSRHEHEELRNFFPTPRMPLRTYARTLPVRPPHILHSQSRLSRPRLPTGLPDVHAANPAATVAAQSRLPSMDKGAKQTDTLRHDVERPLPEPQLSANASHIDLTLPEWEVDDNESAPPGLLPLDELSQNVQQRGAEPRQLSAYQPKINPMLLERAVRDSKPIKQSTGRIVGQIVARQLQRKYGPAAGYGEKLLDDIAKELDTGLHRSTVIAVSYKELSGHDINPQLFEMAENDVVEAAQTAEGTWDSMLDFCMYILATNREPGQEDAERLMDEMDRMHRRGSEVRAGKGKWLCVATHYRRLASKASARSGDTNNISMGDRGNVRKTIF